MPWTVACQASLSLGFPMQDSGMGCYFLLWGIFPTEGSNRRLLHCQADSLPLGHQGSPGKCLIYIVIFYVFTSKCVYLFTVPPSFKKNCSKLYSLICIFFHYYIFRIMTCNYIRSFLIKRKMLYSIPVKGCVTYFFG